ncbi:hypothetical protein DRW07_02210 [Alteromonas sediminis]|uniref:Outer membrane protein beta-barrel domain-containing protein n=1 Tax=Alteromonas sediminis TaxID=2259342 RepID=A0A3N5Y324_9ALTE|nr:outer membrane beta-barrel protein [Alteromonas sediminis]RPJ68242.1 hypothetical protein DRW07_02210 [Alteromonas sediminis]
MTKAIKLAALALTMSCAMSVSATERMYGVVGLGYADSEIANSSTSDLSYRLALGHQFDRQWYVELGYQKLVDDSGDGPGTGLTADALSISALGKAANRSGELFYRMGLANVDLKGQALVNNDDQCEVGGVIGQTADMVDVCGFDEGVFAGVVGLGFDYHLGLNTMLRLEGEYMFGEDDFSTGAVYVGIRYNFN